MSDALITNPKLNGTGALTGGTFTVQSGASLVSATGSTINLASGTVTLPSDVTRLGSVIDLATADVTGVLPGANMAAMVGDSGTGGTKGAVPAPAAGDDAAGKFLKAGGTWAVPTGIGNAVQLQGRTLASTAPSDTQVITWNAGSSQWEPGTGTGNALKLQNRTLASTAPADTQALVWNAGAAQWEPQDQSGSGGGGTFNYYTGNSVLQNILATYTTWTGTTAAIPADDTIPQNTEGLELIDQAITPKHASSYLVIRVTIPQVAFSTGGYAAVAALFKDSDANALAVGLCQQNSSTERQGIFFVYKVASGSTTARNYKLRFGPHNSGATAYVNGSSSARWFGGVAAVTMEITEILDTGTLAFTFNSTSKTLKQWRPLDHQPPSSNYPTPILRNTIPALAFDASTEETTYFTARIPENANLTSGLKFFVTWSATSATSGDAVWGVAVMRCNTDLDTDSFDTAVEATTTTDATSGIPVTTTLTITTIDSAVAGDMVRIKVYRKAAAAGDTMTGDAELLSLEMQSVQDPDGKAGATVSAIVSEGTTARSLTTADIGKYIRLTNSSSCTITLPTDASAGWDAQAFPPVIFFRVADAGIPTISHASVTLNDPLGIVAGLATGSNFGLQRVGSDTWDVV